MIHNEYLLDTATVLQQNKRMFNWDIRPKEELCAPLWTNTLLADQRLKEYFQSIKDWTRRIFEEHGQRLHGVEVIIGKWELDDNFSTVFFRWSSSRGVFMREFALETIVRTDYVLVAMPVQTKMTTT